MQMSLKYLFLLGIKVIGKKYLTMLKVLILNFGIYIRAIWRF